MRRNKTCPYFFILLAELFLCASPPLYAQSESEKLKKIERDLEKTRKESLELESKSLKLAREANALRAELIALSQSVQQRESNVTRLENALASILVEEKQARKSLEERHGQSVETMMALQRLALNPPEAVIAQPQPPADMVRSAILLRSIVPQIQKQAADLRQEVSDYAQKRQLLEAQKERLQLASADLDKERADLDKKIKAKKTLSATYLKNSKAAQKRMARLAREAKDLRALLDKLAQEKKRQKAADQKKAKEKAVESDNDTEIVLGKPPSARSITKAKGKLARPASGRVVMNFGAKEKLGGKHKGISIKTRKGAQIVATYDGQVAFAGPFRGYKQLLIIEHIGGYHTLLTGMERIDVSVGQWLLSGEPIGVMSSNSSQDATLYFELRKKGAPINPLPWIRRQNAKAQG